MFCGAGQKSRVAHTHAPPLFFHSSVKPLPANMLRCTRFHLHHHHQASPSDSFITGDLQHQRCQRNDLEPICQHIFSFCLSPSSVPPCAAKGAPPQTQPVSRSRVTSLCQVSMGMPGFPLVASTRGSSSSQRISSFTIDTLNI